MVVWFLNMFVHRHCVLCVLGWYFKWGMLNSIKIPLKFKGFYQILLIIIFIFIIIKK